MNQDLKFNVSGAVRMMALLVFALVGLFVTMVVEGLCSNLSQFSSTLVVVLAQDVLAFILPAIIVTFLFYRRPWHQMRLDKAPSWRAIGLVVIVCFVSIPALNWVVQWNEGLHLPQSMAGIEEAMRHSEEMAREMSDLLLAQSGLLSTLAVLAVVGIMAGVSEEIFFRGGMLRMTSSGGSHLAVWTVAIVFSAMHVQFFGFFPRMLLGVWLGYLMVWTRSLWVPIIAHALNNSLVVVVTWMANKGYVAQDTINTMGLPQQGHFPWLSLASAIATIVIIVALNHSIRATDVKK